MWPLCVRFNEEFDDTFTLLLQLACIIHMKGDWTRHTIRIFVVIETDSRIMSLVVMYYTCCLGNGDMEMAVIKDFLVEARIEAKVQVHW